MGNSFSAATQERASNTNDLIPFWIYEGDEHGSRIEEVPVLPLSREIGRFSQLKQTLAIYRAVIGQPASRSWSISGAVLDDETLRSYLRGVVIDLSPRSGRMVVRNCGAYIYCLFWKLPYTE